MSTNDGYEAMQEESMTQKKCTRHPCVLCQKRKVRCDRIYPCANCRKTSTECISPTTLPPRIRKARFPEAELLARLRRYEHHLKSYGADLDAINSEISVRAEETQLLKPSPHDSATDQEGIKQPLAVPRSLRRVENNLWGGASEEVGFHTIDYVNNLLTTAVAQKFREVEEILQGSSDDEMFKNSISKTFDSIPSHEDSTDLVFGSPRTASLIGYHPSPIQIFRLWQIYLDNVNPLTKIFHASSVQQQLLDAAADLENVPKNMEALMFGIYAMAIMSLTEEECQKTFGRGKRDLLFSYQSGARKALINAGYLKSSDLMLLQAFTLYLLSSFQMTYDPRSMFCMSGIAIRIAQRMGLSSDGSKYGLLPFEAEMKRRVWWQIVLIDQRLGELSGSGSAILYRWNTKLPLNVNDSDLFPDMREQPIEQSGVSEMVFVRVRCEHLHVIQQLHGMPRATKEKVIDDFEQRIERDYVTHCDSSIPLHYCSITLARSAFAKLRILQPHTLSSFHSSASSMPQHEKDKVFLDSLTMIENHNLLMKNPAAQKFAWQFFTNLPIPAHVHIICALRHRTTDELAEKAWRLLGESFDDRESRGSSMGESAMHLALANLTIKAWEARVQALQLIQQNIATPRFVSKMRQQLAAKRGQNQATSMDFSMFSNMGSEQGATNYGVFNPTSVFMDPFNNPQQLGSFYQSHEPPEWGFLMGDTQMQSLAEMARQNSFQN